MSKDTADGHKKLDINWLNRKGYLSAGSIGNVSWSRNGEPAGSIFFRTAGNTIILEYKSRSYSSDWESVSERISLDWTRCNYGGLRPWFICPHCHRRVGKLYGAGKYFLCRHCYNLAYESQREPPRDRGLTKAQNIRNKLGGSMNMFEPFPPKPKGMHWKTYSHLYMKYQHAEAKCYAALAGWLDGLNSKRRIMHK